jgi:hypothetical protein
MVKSLMAWPLPSCALRIFLLFYGNHYIYMIMDKFIQLLRPQTPANSICEAPDTLETTITITGLDAHEVLKEQELEERQVIVHITLFEPTRARIWPTTYLICRQSGHRSKLLHTEGITLYPTWGYIPAGGTFTLIFEGLPDACTLFDLEEVIPEPGAFIARNVGRNESDVYQLEMR